MDLKPQGLGVHEKPSFVGLLLLSKIVELELKNGYLYSNSNICHLSGFQRIWLVFFLASLIEVVYQWVYLGYVFEVRKFETS